MKDRVSIIPRLDRWSAGEAIRAEKLNQSVDALRASGPVGGPRQIIRPISRGGGSSVQQFRFKAMHGDYIDCVTWDGETEGTETIKVAKPYLLRRTPFDALLDPTLTRDGFIYEYSSDIERTVKNSSEAVIGVEIVTPNYVVDDEIWAEQPSAKIDARDEEDQPFEWIELNKDGRSWGHLS